MKRIVLALMLTAIASSAYAYSPRCKPEKKLSGAALTSFMKKCATDKCTAHATEKKYHGAAKASYIKKCVSDTVGH
ncbi:hypothetical protein [Methylovirgula sp. HY1]|uniref:hypothetical protein n=1 Tax=Methylovirgula sp. HY1 TaxID=2822761 RepID=UPI001C5BAE82|nr:hypothetical protein [Methylovirgula sp. HY1]QXX73662.1 hypothetical protein MHY1_00459 [Methylovirgula sp. HY1]